MNDRENARVPLPSDDRARAEVLAGFSGLWIAVWEDEIVAAGRSADEVFEAIDKLDLPEASVTRIPEPQRGVHVGLG